MGVVWGWSGVMVGGECPDVGTYSRVVAVSHADHDQGWGWVGEG